MGGGGIWQENAHGALVLREAGRGGADGKSGGSGWRRAGDGGSGSSCLLWVLSTCSPACGATEHLRMGSELPPHATYITAVSAWI